MVRAEFGGAFPATDERPLFRSTLFRVYSYRTHLAAHLLFYGTSLGQKQLSRKH